MIEDLKRMISRTEKMELGTDKIGVVLTIFSSALMAGILMGKTVRFATELIRRSDALVSDAPKMLDD